MPEWQRSAGRDAVATLLARWPVIVAVMILGGLAGFGASALQTATYAADVTMYVSSGTALRPVSAYEDALASQSRAVSYARLVHSSQVLQPAVARSGVEISAEDLDEHVTATTTPETVLLTITVSDEDRDAARRLVAAIASSMTTKVAELETPPGGGTPLARLSVLDDATTSTNPVSPSRVLNIAVGVVIALVLGVIGVLFAERRNNRLRSVGDVVRLTGSAPLVVLPADRALRKSPIADFGPAETPSAAQYRRLRNSVLGHIDQARIRRVVLVTSPRDGNGKSTVALNLSIAIAETGHSVCLISPWSRLSMLEAQGIPALPESLAVTAIEDAFAGANVDVALATIREDFDEVIVDGGAILEGSLAETVARSADVVLMVAQRRRTRVSELRFCAERLSLVSAAEPRIVMSEHRRSTSGGRTSPVGGAARAAVPVDVDTERPAGGRHSPPR